MKKIILVVLALCLCVPLAFASQNRTQTVFVAGTTLAQEESQTSAVFSVGGNRTFGAWLKLGTLQTIKTPSGTASNIDIEFAQSYSGADGTWATSTTLVIDNWTDSGVATVVTISPSPMKYLRFRAYGSSANSTATTINMYLFTQDQ